MLRLRDHPEGSTSTARAKVCVSLRSLRAIIKFCEEVGHGVKYPCCIKKNIGMQENPAKICRIWLYYIALNRKILPKILPKVLQRCGIEVIPIC